MMGERPVSVSRTKALSDRRSKPRQLDLFGGSRPRSAGNAPAWSALPAEARSELIDLMRQLILEHVDRERRNAAGGVGHEL